VARPRFGIDFDGVLIDNRVLWLEHYLKNAGHHSHAVIDTKQAFSTWDYLPDLCAECFDDCLHSEEIVLGHRPRFALRPALAALSAVADLYLITKRPEKSYDLSEAWMVNHLVRPYFVDLIFTQHKAQICLERNITHHLDDSPKVIEELQATSVVPIIFDMPFNVGIPGERVTNWREATQLFLRLALSHGVSHAQERETTEQGSSSG
jgi:hypothetical protein